MVPWITSTHGPNQWLLREQHARAGAVHADGNTCSKVHVRSTSNIAPGHAECSVPHLTSGWCPLRDSSARVTSNWIHQHLHWVLLLLPAPAFHLHVRALSRPALSSAQLGPTLPPSYPFESLSLCPLFPPVKSTSYIPPTYILTYRHTSTC